MSNSMMSGMHDMSLWLAVPVSLLLVLGGLITLTGALGLLRLPNFYQRIHGPAVYITVGTGCFLIASMLYSSVALQQPIVHELLITGFVILTAPVVSMMLMRAAVYRDLRKGNTDNTPGNAYKFPREH